MINKQKSIALYGAPGCGSKYIAKELSERTGLPVIPVRQLAFLPNKKDLDKAVRFSQLSITNLQEERDAYKKRLDSIYKSEKKINQGNYDFYVNDAQKAMEYFELKGYKPSIVSI